MSKNKKRSLAVPKTTQLLWALVSALEQATDSLDAFLLSAGSVSQLKRNLSKLKREDYRSSWQSLRVHGYIKRANNNQFLITPKGVRKFRISKIEAENWRESKWDGFWRIIAFDIPEGKKRERNIFRALITRKGFIGIQHSVFIAPYADFEALAELRKDLKIEKYVSFFTAKSYETDDDSMLRKQFDLG